MAGYERSTYLMYLGRVPMFSRCAEEDLDALAGLATAVVREKGVEVVREGAEGDAFYVVTAGEASVRRDGQAVAQLGPGDYFGELALFDPAPRNASVVAASQLSLVMLTRAAFATALDQIPALRDALLHGMARRLHELDAKV